MRDPRRLDQNPVVIDPANVEAVLEDRPTPVSSPSKPPSDEIDDADVSEEEREDAAALDEDVPSGEGEAVSDTARRDGMLVGRIPGEPELDLPADDDEN